MYNLGLGLLGAAQLFPWPAGGKSVKTLIANYIHLGFIYLGRFLPKKTSLRKTRTFSKKQILKVFFGGKQYIFNACVYEKKDI